jgi:molybdopterin converting factor small subunit
MRQGGGARVSVTIVLPGQLKPLAAGHSTVSLEGRAGTVGEAFAELRARHPAVYDRVFTEQGDLRPHVNVFVGRDDIRWSGGMDTPVPRGAEVTILPSVSGG